MQKEANSPKGINKFKIGRNSISENQSFQLSITRKIRPYFHACLTNFTNVVALSNALAF